MHEGGLLERSAHLSALSESLEQVRHGAGGRLILVAGEAGVGKTALVREFCSRHGRLVRVLSGTCDPFFTPRPLAPFVEIAEQAGPPLPALLTGEARPHEIVATLLRSLGMRTETILVLDDLHWADEASLDVFHLLARRMAEARVMIVASYRDDELDRAHPLRVVLGELATSDRIRRISLERLSFDAVATLARGAGLDPETLYAKTDGNPFFVSEVLAAPEGDIPGTVRDAVLARAARLDPPGRSLLEAAAILVPQAEVWLLELLAPAEIDRLDGPLASGMLIQLPRAVAFRHELARRSIEDSLPPHRAVSLHRAALAALGRPPIGRPDAARLAHHAEAASDGPAVLAYAPVAGAEAGAVGSHREAAAQFARALRFAGAEPDDVRAGLLERRSHESYLSDRTAEAIEALEAAIEIHRRSGDRLREGDALRSLAQMRWSSGETGWALEAAGAAVALLEQLPPGRELAMAYAVLASRQMNADDFRPAASSAARALELAGALGDVEILAHATTTLGTIAALAGVEPDEGTPATQGTVATADGEGLLERARLMGEAAGSDEATARAFASLAYVATRTRRYERFLRDGPDWIRELGDRGLDLWRLYLLGYWARALLDQGRWTEAADAAGLVLRVPQASSVPTITALTVLGLIRARRGDPDAWSALDAAQRLARKSGELQRVGPVAAALAEAAWLGRKDAAIAPATEDALELATRLDVGAMVAELTCWRRRAGLKPPARIDASGPHGRELAGDWIGAADLWSALGCRYEAALALAESAEEAPRLRALAELQVLGARTAAAIVARGLRLRGVRGVPRGPRPSTRSNPAKLTDREVDVLQLVAQGLRNAEIGQRLSLSEKTVDHYVSAVLAKLDVRSRTEAAGAAVRLGLAREPGGSKPPT